MQFVKDGPDIPERLLQDHEDGRVVFFCGAGISYPAGLPLFGGLVDGIYAELGTTRTEIEEQVFKKGQFDAVLDLLEHRYPGHRVAVRTALCKVLRPNLRKKGATETHKSLLTLSTDRRDKVRLITTNFDRIFHEVLTKAKSTVPEFPAPLLPIPKDSRWHGVVYLHGLLPKSDDESGLNRLVMTSGDFGLAYLTERWAARFVSELFRNYTVCFVGYSINDPVLRYMMDALAADRMLGHSTPNAYAFGSFDTGDRERSLLEWESKRVIPMLYEVRTRTYDHSVLHASLKCWADTYRDGSRGKELIISQEAANPPIGSSRLDFSVGRVLWAISDQRGIPAKHFAELNPVPPLKWLDPIAEDQYRHEHLSLFGVAPNAQENKKLAFSVARRPAPYLRAQWMSLICRRESGDLDDVLFHLARWLTRHLGDPELLLWVVKHGAPLQHQFAALILRELSEFDRLRNENNEKAIAKIRSNAPNAIPGEGMRKLWNVVLSGRLKLHGLDLDLHHWLINVKANRLTTLARLELRDLLSPRVSIRKRFADVEQRDGSNETKKIDELVNWEITLSADNVAHRLREIRELPSWKESLPGMLQDFQALLLDALDLMHDLNGADARSDHSYLHQPSIEQHPQNRAFQDWTALIELTRDAWLATSEVNRERSASIAESWWLTPYPLFKRLALFAATRNDVVDSATPVRWLVSENAWWLWSVETQHEVMKLLPELAPRLTSDQAALIEDVVIKGPPRSMFRDDVSAESWQEIVHHGIWFRLRKMASAATLSEPAKTKLAQLELQYPHWNISSDDRGDFPFWMGTGHGDSDDLWRTRVMTPKRRKDLVAYIKASPALDNWRDDDWRQRCQDSFPVVAVALIELARDGEWPTDRWRDALHAWSDDKLIKLSWRRMASRIGEMPDQTLRATAPALSSWLQAAVKAADLKLDERLYLALASRILKASHSELNDDARPVDAAINHPIGRATEALVDWWYRQSPTDNQKLNGEIRSIFSDICNRDVAAYRHGRVILAAHVVALFRVDAAWTAKHLLPNFDWSLSADAHVAWEGFLWSPRFFRPLMDALRIPFLNAATRYVELGDHAEQYASFFAYVALEGGDVFTDEELAEAMRSLPSVGLTRAAETVSHTLESAGEQRNEYWRNRVLPFMKKIWPKSIAVDTPAIAEAIGRICIAADAAFPEALNAFKHWLPAVNEPSFLTHRLHDRKLCARFPQEALSFLDNVVNKNIQWRPHELKECLTEIAKMDATLLRDPRYLRLEDLIRA